MWLKSIYCPPCKLIHHPPDLPESLALSRHWQCTQCSRRQSVPVVLKGVRSSRWPSGCSPSRRREEPVFSRAHGYRSTRRHVTPHLFGRGPRSRRPAAPATRSHGDPSIYPPGLPQPEKFVEWCKTVAVLLFVRVFLSERDSISGNTKPHCVVYLTLKEYSRGFCSVCTVTTEKNFNTQIL